uniref:cellulase n=1 Tax=Timema cristinae TaxID=61476 RepID=A0A7R9CJN5_TIMCR|nr:unnamed protein product [Timema cristinae]
MFVEEDAVVACALYVELFKKPEKKKTGVSAGRVKSTDYGDELTWAAAWLYKATSESQYLDEAEHNYMKFRLKERPNEFFYNKKVAGVQLRLLLELWGGEGCPLVTVEERVEKAVAMAERWGAARGHLKKRTARVRTCWLASLTITFKV